MTNLTKEYLDAKLSKLALKSDLETLDKKIDERFDELAQLVSRGFEDIDKRIGTKVDKLEQKVAKVEHALNIKL